LETYITIVVDYCRFTSLNIAREEKLIAEEEFDVLYVIFSVELITRA
jgi:hypothetical protein